MKAKTNNLIPSAATVTLPASDYYALIKLANDLIKERDIQFDAIKVVKEGGRVTITHAEERPYTLALAEHISELLAKDDDAMDMLFASDQHCYTAYNSWLDNYSWNVDLLKFNNFAAAWERAERRNANERKGIQISTGAYGRCLRVVYAPIRRPYRPNTSRTKNLGNRF